MALPVVDGSTALTSANLHWFIFGDDVATGNYMLRGYRIHWSASVWAVSQSFGTKASYAQLGVTWNAGDKRLDLDFGSFSPNFAASPLAIVTPWCGTATGANAFNHKPHVRITSATAGYVRFEDRTTINNEIGTEDTSMIFGLLLLGQIA